MKTVIFACVHNAGRSQMAAAYFNAAADPAVARAVSAGTQPDSTCSTATRRHRVSMSDKMCTALKIAGACRMNIVISGGTGSGKTTMLNAMSKMIDPGERVLTIEDAAELRLQQPHWLPLETRPPNLEGQGAITIRESVISWVCGKSQKAMAKMRRQRAEKLAGAKKVQVPRAKQVKAAQQALVPRGRARDAHARGARRHQQRDEREGTEGCAHERPGHRHPGRAQIGRAHV